jgi:ATP synthase protein I
MATGASNATRGRTWKRAGMAEDEHDEDPELPRDARLGSLDERLKQAREAEAKRTGAAAPTPQTGQVQGMRILSVLVSYPAGSALIGFAVDRFAGTRGVWVAMLFVGFGVAMWEVWKISNQKPQ